jgi:hypothetical protein
MPAALYHVQEALQVRSSISMRVDQRVPHTRLSSKMDHERKAMFHEQARHSVAVGNVEFDESKSRKFRELREASLL